MSNAAEFADWKKHPITEKVFNEFKAREGAMTLQLSLSAGEHPPTDRYLVGYIAALRDVFLMEWEDSKDD